MDATQAASALCAALPELSSQCLTTLVSEKLSGRRLLAMEADLLERCGVSPGDAQDVRHLVAVLRHGAPKRVRILPDQGAENAGEVELVFETPQELREFLAAQGAGYLCAGDSRCTTLMQLKEGECYTLGRFRGNRRVGAR